jgi:Major Facilitator Superfamily
VSAFGRFRPLLARPGVRALAWLGFLAQCTQGAAPVAIVLAVTAAGGGYALAGATLAGYAVAAGACRPVQGRALDRRGPHAVLPFAIIAHAIGLTGVVALTMLGRPGDRGPLYVLAGAVGGAGLPAISASMRLLLVRPGDVEKAAVYSLVALTQEAAILVSPLLVAAFAALGSARLALFATTLVAVGGTLGFAARARRGRPPPDETRPARGRLLTGGMVAVQGFAALWGTAVGACEFGAPAFARSHGYPALGGTLAALVSIGGIAGAALSAAMRPDASPALWAAMLMMLFGFELTMVAVTGTLLAAGVLLLFAGLPLTATYTMFALLVDAHAPAGRIAEAFAWLSTANAAGVSTGSAVAGFVAQRAGADAVFMQGGLAAMAGAATMLALRRHL